MEKGSEKIDLVVSVSTSSVLPVLAFHSTVVMNIFTGRSFVVLYPSLTFNDCTAILRNIDFMKTPEKTMVSISKHLSRGIKLVNINKVVFGNVQSHECEVHENCPHTIRFVDDKHSLSLSIAFEDKTLDSIQGAVWRYGGEQCFNGTQALGALIICNSGVHYNETTLVSSLVSSMSDSNLISLKVP